eukprot:TRINITY_DN75412_c0_g1_i1.p1 TRINITY_DN75412_c0_g1~~TRINITY_DN75412_c0_g1_i1.p1  ORF type:complete len:610 (+),score=160.57 TRINITY_DN75412_c0_g1_i1:198-1832(+)
MAANMDPTVMENMMKSMGGSVPAGMDMKKMSEQMGNMSPEQLRAGMSQAQGQMDAQKQYVMNGAVVIKNEGNDLIRKGEYKQALTSYDRALENLRPHSGDDVKQLRLSLLLNAALCHLKLKAYQKSIDMAEEALTINAKSVKAIFRRGLARFELGQLPQAIADVKLAHKLSPEDKAVATELTRLQTECIDRGLKEEDIEAATKAAEEKACGQQAPTTTPGVPRSLAPGDSSGAASGPTGDNKRMMEAMNEFSKNPAMWDQASEAMKNMSPADLERMMESQPLPPGVDRETMRKNMEAMTKNPGMFKTAVDGLKDMPEEQLQKILSRQAAGSGGTDTGADAAKISSMAKVFEDPEAMKQITEMAKTMGSDSSTDPGEADMMRKAAEALSSNPELGQQMSSMLSSMPPEQLQKMMEMSSGMRKKKGGGGQEAGMNDPAMMNDPEKMNDAMSSFMDDPEMMKAAEEMMKSMSPETLAAMAKSSGIDLDENKAKMIGKLMPYVPWLFKGMRGFQKVKKGVKSVFTNRGRVIIAIVVLLAAIIQHWRSS